MDTFVPHNLFVVGGTGYVGTAVVTQLLASNQFNVKILVRRETMTSKKDLVDRFAAAGGVIVQVEDTKDVATMTELLKGSDTLLSVVGGQALFDDTQFKLLEAAKLSGIRRFLPSEYSYDWNSEEDPFFSNKAKLRQELEASGLEYTYIVTGGFYDFLFSKRMGFDYEGGKIQLAGDGNTRVFGTELADVGRFVVYILRDPATRNSKVFAVAADFSYLEAVKIFEEETVRKYDVSYDSLETLKETSLNTELDFMTRIVAHIKMVVFQGAQYQSSMGKYKDLFPITIREKAREMLGKHGI